MIPICLFTGSNISENSMKEHIEINNLGNRQIKKIKTEMVN